MFQFSRNARRHAKGFSLVEILVAMVIGMLGMIVMLQVYSNSERQKSATSGGNEAQNAGAIALYGLQRDIQQSGWGISSVNLLGCDVQLRAGVTLSEIAPVTINPASAVVPAGDANTDTLLIVYGNGNGGQEGDAVTAAPAVNTYSVASPYGFNPGDWIIAEPQARPTPCDLALDQIDPAGVAAPDVTVATGLAGMTNGTLYNLGQAPTIRAYAVRGGNLTVCDYMTNDCGDVGNSGDATIWVPIANDIVSLQAVYGRDTLTSVPPDDPAQTSYIVDTGDNTTPTTACGWLRTPAIGIALVARNSQSKQTGVTTALAWGQGMGGPFPIDLTQNPDGTANADWQNYRYKVFQTIAPIRNITIKGVQSGC